MSRRFRAPGKLVLAGEYAVLDGAPAIVAAVDRGVECAVGWSSRVEVEAPGDDRFVRAALEQCEAPPGHYVFRDWRPVEGIDGKPGFGGSAAATVVAVLAALRMRGEDPFPDQLQALATDVHQMVQGSGSGVDVAASVHGGVLRFEAGRVTRVDAPRFLVVWSGGSSATGPRVQRYEQWTDRADFVARSRSLVEGFASDPVTTLRDNRRLLEEMADRAQLLYQLPDTARICDLAEAEGGGAKPSGAGGGDCVVAVLPDDEARLRFGRACHKEGYPVIPVHVVPGARELL